MREFLGSCSLSLLNCQCEEIRAELLIDIETENLVINHNIMKLYTFKLHTNSGLFKKGLSLKAF